MAFVAICQEDPKEEDSYKTKCQNGSGCVAHNYWPFYSCACLEGFYGEFCEHKSELDLFIECIGMM